MGKGSRTKAITDEMRQRIEEENRKKAKSKKIKKIVIIVLCVIIAASGLGIGGYFGVNAYLTNTGYTLRNTICMTSDDYNITDAQLSYYFAVSVASYSSSSSSETGSDFDSTKSLKEQEYTLSDDYDTWFDYFLSQAQARLENAVCYAQAAAAEGMKLNDEDKSSIDSTISSMESSAKEKSQTLDEYLSESYAKGVNESDIRSCLELSKLANKYFSQYEANINYSEKQMNDFYNKDAKKYNAIDYISYEVKASTTDESTKEQTEKLMSTAKAEANKIAVAKTESEFNSLLTSYLTEYYKSSGTKKTASDIKTEVSACKTEDSAYTETVNTGHKSEISKWAFNSSRKPFDTTVIEDKETESYTVVMLLTTQHKLTYATKNVRHILLTDNSYGDAAEALTSAQNLLQEIRKSDDVEKAFIEDAEKYTEDTASAADGGLYANVKKGEMVESFNDWCYYADRKPGDTAIIRSDYGYHIMYFVSNGIPAWQGSLIDDMKTDEYKNLVDELKTKYKIKFNIDEAKKLDK